MQTYKVLVGMAELGGFGDPGPMLCLNAIEKIRPSFVREVSFSFSGSGGSRWL